MHSPHLFSLWWECIRHLEGQMAMIWCGSHVDRLLSKMPPVLVGGVELCGVLSKQGHITDKTCTLPALAARLQNKSEEFPAVQQPYSTVAHTSQKGRTEEQLKQRNTSFPHSSGTHWFTSARDRYLWMCCLLDPPAICALQQHKNHGSNSHTQSKTRQKLRVFHFN